MTFNRQTALRQWARAKAGANNPLLPQSIQNLYQQAADHGQVALGLSNALEMKSQQDALRQAPPPDQLQPPQAQQPSEAPSLFK